MVVVGPTAAGKSELAVTIAEWLDGEVVSADAFQVYRGLDIGTAKISPDEARGVPHHCIDIVDPDEHYTAGRYARDAQQAIAVIEERGRTAIVAGGSGFYVRALVEGLAPLPEQDPRWRAALEAVGERRGDGHLFAMLQALDPEWAAAVGAADRQRILRGLEVTLRLGVPISVAAAAAQPTEARFDAVWIGLTVPRETLNARIEQRIDDMLAAGWLTEVRRLVEAFGADAPGMRAIGYRQLAAHLAGDLDLEEARDDTVRATRQYAKRQLTWFRRQSPAVFFELDRPDDPATVAAVYQRIRAHLDENLACYG